MSCCCFGGVFVIEAVSVIFQVASFKSEEANIPHGSDPPPL